MRTARHLSLPRQLGDSDIKDRPQLPPVGHAQARQQRHQQHPAHHAVRHDHLRLARPLRRQPVPNRTYAVADGVERLGAVRGVAGVAVDPAPQRVRPDAVGAVRRRAAQGADRPLVQVRLDAQRQTAGPRDRPGRVARRSMADDVTCVGGERRQGGRRRLGLASAALAQTDVRLGAVENQGVGGLAVTQQKDAGWHGGRSSANRVGLLPFGRFA